MTDVPSTIHVPVLVQEVIQYLQPAPGQTIVDATFGTGGHSLLICELLKQSGLLIGIDRDETTLNIARERLNEYKEISRFFSSDYKDLDEILKACEVDRIDGILFDLGISAVQLEDPARGFSFMAEGPLDMRMNTQSGITAYDVVNGYECEELARIFAEYSDERRPERAARLLIEERTKKTIETTKELSDILRRVSYGRKGTRHPEAPLFQAIRIEVNREFESIRQGISKGIRFLNPGGRVCVISFHSGEDRIVKNLFKEFEREGMVKIITKKPVCAGIREVHANWKSRSAKLRVAERAQE